MDDGYGLLFLTFSFWFPHPTQLRIQECLVTTVDEEKIRAIVNMPRPSNAKEVQGFMFSSFVSTAHLISNKVRNYALHGSSSMFFDQVVVKGLCFFHYSTHCFPYEVLHFYSYSAMLFTAYWQLKVSKFGF